MDPFRAVPPERYGGEQTVRRPRPLGPPGWDDRGPATIPVQPPGAVGREGETIPVQRDGNTLSLFDSPDQAVQPDRDGTDTLPVVADQYVPSPPVAAPPVVARDRLWPHLLWEVVLLAGCATAVLLLVADDRQVFSGDAGRDLALWTATTILLGSAFSLSLRATAPNLAVGATAAAGGAAYVWLVAEEGWDALPALGLVLGGGAVTGLALALIVVVFAVPGWAVGLGLAGLLVGALDSGALDTDRSLGSETPDVGAHPEWWLGAVTLLSVAGGVLLALRPFRRFVGRGRGVRDPAGRPGAVAGLAVLGALVGSGVLAASGGLLQVAHLGLDSPGAPGAADLTALALAAALLGGVSVHGRRGGVFGVVLASVLLVLGRFYLTRRGVDPWVLTVAFGAAVLLGLIVTRLMERLGGAKEPDQEALRKS